MFAIKVWVIQIAALSAVYVQLCDCQARSCSSITLELFACLQFYGILEQTNSLLNAGSIYIPVCPAKNEFLQCFLNALVLCPNYKQENPFVMGESQIRVMLYGVCTHAKAFKDGQNCLGANYENLKFYIDTQIFDNTFLYTIQEALNAHNYSTFCHGYDDRIAAMENLLQSFQCGEGFNIFVIQAVKTLQPSECEKKDYVWLEEFLEYSISKASSVQYGTQLFTLLLMLHMLHA